MRCSSHARMLGFVTCLAVLGVLRVWGVENHVLIWGRAGRLVGEASGDAREIAWMAWMGLDFFRLLGRLGLLLLELIAIACFILYGTRPLKDIAFMNNILARKANLPSTIKYCMQASLYPSIMLPACVDADADADAIDPVKKKEKQTNPPSHNKLEQV